MPIPPRHIASPEITKQLAGEYPATVAKLAGKWGSVFKIPVTWIRSQAYAESRNVPTVMGPTLQRKNKPPTNAYGVLQLLPETAIWLVKSLASTTYARNDKIRETLANGWHGRPEDLFNPDLNVMLAAYYMLVLKRKFDTNDHDIVAAAYNAGPVIIANRLDAGQPLPQSSMIYLAMVKDAKRRGFM
jgi:soluble lytic murein transglycosylase-like protein